jgi:hypothetical protein
VLRERAFDGKSTGRKWICRRLNSDNIVHVMPFIGSAARPDH